MRFLFLFCILISTNVFAANRYWVATSSSDWNNSANWAALSGGVGGSSVPGIHDIAIFDGIIGTGDCAIDLTLSVSGFHISGYSGKIDQGIFGLTIGSNGWKQHSGNFAGGSNTISFINNGNIEIQGGVFTATSGSILLSGIRNSNQTIFTHSGGIFNHNNGTLVINPTNGCIGVTHTLDITTTTTFYNVIINPNYTCNSIPIITTAAGDILVVKNNLTHSDGAINGFIHLANNLVVNTSADGGIGTIVFNGINTQTYSVNSAASITCGIEVNKHSKGVVPAVGTVDLTCTKFTLRSGNFTAPTNRLTIGGVQNSSQILFGHISGNFDANNGTVHMNTLNGCGSVEHFIDINPTTEFYNVDINLNSSCNKPAIFSTSVGDILKIKNNFRHIDGVIKGSYSLQGNLIIESSSDGGSGLITFNGSGMQNYMFGVNAMRTCGFVIDKISGTVSPSVGTTDLLIQNFRLITGEFTAPTGQLSIGGAMDKSQTLYSQVAGKFNHNNGTLLINPVNGCLPIVHTIDVIPSTYFYNIILKATSSCNMGAGISISRNDTLHVLNNLNLSAGKTLNSFIDVAGNLYIEAGFEAGNTSEVILVGSTNTTIDAQNATALFDGPLKFNKSSGLNTVTLLSDLILDAPSQSITFTKGRLISTTNTLLVLGNNVGAQGANNQSYVSGPVKKIGNTAFVFPVGKTKSSQSHFYRPISISAPVYTTDEFTAEYFALDVNPYYSSISKDLSLDHISRCEFWLLDRTTGSSNVDVIISWKDSSSCGVTNPATLRVAGWDGLMWKDYGNGGTIGNLTLGEVISVRPVTSYGPFTLSSSNQSNPLPINLISFEAGCSGRNIDLNWSTASEKDNECFTIERSNDGRNWEAIKRIQGAGNSNYLLSYRFTDSRIDKINPYYRLIQTDYDGNRSISEIIKVTCQTRLTTELGIFPNPSSGTFNILNNFSELVRIVVYDMMGKKVAERNLETKSIIQLDLHILPKGIYSVQYMLQDELKTQRLILN